MRVLQKFHKFTYAILKECESRFAFEMTQFFKGSLKGGKCIYILFKVNIPLGGGPL